MACHKEANGVQPLSQAGVSHSPTHLLVSGNTLLPPHPLLGYMEPGTELMLRDGWQLPTHCPYHLETAASGLPGVWITLKPSV